MLAFTTGCNNTPESNTDTYTIKAESARFQGRLVSSQIEQYDYDASTYELKVANGQQVTEGTVLLSLSDTGKQALISDLQDEFGIDSTQSAKTTATSELNSIKKGDYSSSEALSADYLSLKEQLNEIQTEISAQEIVIETAKINYEYEVSSLRNSVNPAPSEPSMEDKYTEDIPEETSDLDRNEDSDTLLEIEKITKLYEKEQETNNLQLEKLKKQYQDIQLKISNFASSLSVKSRVKELEEEIAGYEQNEQKFNQQLESMLSDTVSAKCDGLVVIDSDIIYVYSNEVDFVFTIPARNFQKFYFSDTKYTLQYNNEIVGEINLSYYVPSQTEDMYDLVYTISEQTDMLLLTNTYAYMVSEEEIYIPTAYISQNENGDFFVLKNNEEVTIEAVLIDGQYKMISGLNVGDKIEKIN